MERCPACRGRLGAESVCPRCGCDLSLVLRAREEARRLIVSALRCLAAGRRVLARVQVKEAVLLRNDPLTRAIRRLTEADGISEPWDFDAGRSPYEQPAEARFPAGKES